MSLQVTDLWLDLGEFHLRGVNLEVTPGEYFVILGPTGAGKTVLLETIAGLHSPRRGRVLLNGEDVTQVPRSAVPSGLSIRTTRSSRT